MISRLWPKTRRAWIYVAVFATIFLVLDVFALLAAFAGGLIGILLALAAAYPLIRDLPRASPWRFLWFCMGWISMLGILFGGSALAGIPMFPSAEGGNIGAFIYGLAFGFGPSVCNLALGGGVRSAFTGILFEDIESRGVWTKTSLLAGGAVICLIMLCLLGYLAIEYVLGPIIRSFAQ